MKSLMSLLFAALVVAGAAADAGQGRGRGQGQDQDRGNARGGDARGNQGSNAPRVNVVFTSRDISLIRTHYGNRYKNLPPGLQKKLARGGSLPPGWQKKMEPFPASLERQLIVLGSGHKYGIYDGHAVIYDPLTHAILDIFSLF